MCSENPSQGQSSQQLLLVAGSTLIISFQGGLAASLLGENVVSESLTEL